MPRSHLLRAQENQEDDDETIQCSRVINENREATSRVLTAICKDKQEN